MDMYSSFFEYLAIFKIIFIINIILREVNMKYYKKITDLSRKKRIKKMLLLASILCFMLVIRVGFIQFVQGHELQEMAYIQQTLNRNISPKRGTIWDSTGENILAMSASVESVFVTPRKYFTF